MVTSDTNDVTLAIGNNPGGGWLTGATATTVTAVGGVATFNNMSILKTGSGYTLTASASGLTGATSAPFDITPGPPYGFSFTVQPHTIPLGAPIPTFRVAIIDAWENTVTNDTSPVTVSLSLNPSGATLGGTTSVNAMSGVATFANLTIDLPGVGYRLLAVAPDVPNGPYESDPFDITIPFVAVSAGDRFTCGITDAGAAYCWGYNHEGELGIGIDGFQPTPVAVKGGLVLAEVSAGGDHTCGVTTAGAAYCWGDNAAGELGNGTTTGPDLSPVAVSGGLVFSSLSATGTTPGISYPAFTCGVTTDHAAYCWGDNSAGELGDAATANSATPAAVSGGLAFTTVSGGGGPHACGVTTAGAAYCWGDNSVGELGDGTTTNSTTPVAVSNGLTFASVSAGNGHACGLTSSGAAYCWGWNSYGQLGSGTSGPQKCVALGGTSLDCSLSPVAVTGGLTFTSLSAGWWHTCGLTSSGAAYCWGYGADGELGNGSTGNSSTPVAVAGGLTFTEISGGSQHSCGMTTAGAYCWGDNAWGELGIGRYGAGIFSAAPVLVAP